MAGVLQGGWGIPSGYEGGGSRHLRTVGHAAITPTFSGVPIMGYVKVVPTKHTMHYS